MATVTQVIATIPAGEAVSSVIDCTASKPVRMIMPPQWTGESKDILSFLGSFDNIDWYDLVDHSGKSVTISIVPGTMAVLDIIDISIKGPQYLKIRAGTANEPSEQAAARAFKVIVQAV